MYRPMRGRTMCTLMQKEALIERVALVKALLPAKRRVQANQRQTKTEFYLCEVFICNSP